jgi:hypothetical protein
MHGSNKERAHLVVKALLDSGADPMLKNNAGKDAIALAKVCVAPITKLSPSWRKAFAQVYLIDDYLKVYNILEEMMPRPEPTLEWSNYQASKSHKDIEKALKAPTINSQDRFATTTELRQPLAQANIGSFEPSEDFEPEILPEISRSSSPNLSLTNTGTLPRPADTSFQSTLPGPLVKLETQNAVSEDPLLLEDTLRDSLPVKGNLESPEKANTLTLSEDFSWRHPSVEIKFSSSTPNKDTLLNNETARVDFGEARRAYWKSKGRIATHEDSSSKNSVDQPLDSPQVSRKTDSEPLGEIRQVDPLTILSNAERFVGLNSTDTWLLSEMICVCLRTIINWLSRPTIPAGYRRLEWLTVRLKTNSREYLMILTSHEECGARLYDDFDNNDANQVDSLYHELTENFLENSLPNTASERDPELDATTAKGPGDIGTMSETVERHSSPGSNVRSSCSSVRLGPSN